MFIPLSDLSIQMGIAKKFNLGKQEQGLVSKKCSCFHIK